MKIKKILFNIVVATLLASATRACARYQDHRVLGIVCLPHWLLIDWQEYEII